MPKETHAHLDIENGTVVIEQLKVRDKDVIREAQRWTTGERGPIVDDPAALAEADVSVFVNEAVKIGAHALAATGQSQDFRALERMLKEVGDKAATTTAQAAELTERSVKDATTTLTKAAEDTKKAITAADETTRKEFTRSVNQAKSELNVEIRKIFGGEQPELLERLQLVLDKFGTDLDTKSKATVSNLLATAVKQFDPTDPTSPMAKHTVELEERQRQLTEKIDTNQGVLASKLNDITTALKVQDARTRLTKVTPIKGDAYENQVNILLDEIAAGLGDEYTDTRAVAGALPRCMKGDGLLSVNGGATRVVIEMTDSARAGWVEYLDEAERNRHAGAALGLVRTAEQNGGQSIRVLGARRIVAAFDPDCDDPDLVRTIVMLLRTAALAASSRRGAEQLATIEEKITGAVAQLEKIGDVKKTSATIQKNAVKIENTCTAIYSGIQRLLSDALAALGDITVDETVQTADGAVA